MMGPKVSFNHLKNRDTQRSRLRTSGSSTRSQNFRRNPHTCPKIVETFGGAVIPTDRQLEIFARGGFATITAIPSYMTYWLRRAVALQQDQRIGRLSTLRRLLLGAEPISESLREAIRALALEAGADPNSADPTGETALMIAARVGTLDAGSLLLPVGLVRRPVDRRLVMRGRGAALVLAAALGVSGGVQELAQTTSLLLLSVFTLPHVALLVVKRRDPGEGGGFRTPVWTPASRWSLSQTRRWLPIPRTPRHWMTPLNGAMTPVLTNSMSPTTGPATLMGALVVCPPAAGVSPISPSAPAVAPSHNHSHHHQPDQSAPATMKRRRRSATTPPSKHSPPVPVNLCLSL